MGATGDVEVTASRSAVNSLVAGWLHKKGHMIREDDDEIALQDARPSRYNKKIQEHLTNNMSICCIPVLPQLYRRFDTV